MTIGLLSQLMSFQAVREVEPAPTGTLVRNLDGLIFRDQFNRSDEQLDVSSFWIRTDGTGLDNIVSNKVRPQSPYGDAQTTGIAISTSSMHQINFLQAAGGLGFGSYWARNALAGSQNHEGVGMEWNTGLGTQKLFIERNNIQHQLQTLSGLPGFGAGAITTERIIIEDLGASGIKARFYRKVVGSLTDVTSSIAQIGLEQSTSLANSPTASVSFRATHGATTNDWDEVMIMRDFTIVVQGLPAGYKARVIGSDLTGSSTTESGGVAVINVETTAFPAEGVQVLNAADAIQQSFFSGSGIWAGDQYTFSL